MEQNFGMKHAVVQQNSLYHALEIKREGKLGIFKLDVCFF